MCYRRLTEWWDTERNYEGADIPNVPVLPKRIEKRRILLFLANACRFFCLHRCWLYHSSRTVLSDLTHSFSCHQNVSIPLLFFALWPCYQIPTPPITKVSLSAALPLWRHFLSSKCSYLSATKRRPEVMNWQLHCAVIYFCAEYRFVASNTRKLWRNIFKVPRRHSQICNSKRTKKCFIQRCLVYINIPSLRPK